MLEQKEMGVLVSSTARHAYDGYVAETAVRLDKIQAALDELADEAKWTREVVSGLKEASSQVDRYRAFDLSLQNARDARIDEMLRLGRDLKQRLDEIEGPRAGFLGLAYRSFPAIEARLQELARVEALVKRGERRNWALFAGAIILAAGSLGARFL